FLEPAQLAELAAITEDQAEEMIAYAEEAAERVEKETKAAKAAEAEARAAAPQAAARTSGALTAANLFPPEAPSVSGESRPTAESVFGPDMATKADPALSAAQVFGEKEPAGAVDKEDHPPQEPGKDEG